MRSSLMMVLMVLPGALMGVLLVHGYPHQPARHACRFHPSVAPTGAASTFPAEKGRLEAFAERRLKLPLPTQRRSSSTCLLQTSSSSLPSQNDEALSIMTPFPKTNGQEQQNNKATSDFTTEGDQEVDDDSVDLFARDISKVLDELRCSQNDPTIPTLFHRRPTSTPTFTHPWTVVDWEKHYTRRRFFNYIKGLTNFSSRIVKRIAPQWTVLVLWSVFVSWTHASSASSTSTSSSSTLLGAGAGAVVQVAMERAALPLTPLSLVSTFCAALLTLRTNQCLSRLFDARVAMGNLMAHVRQVAQMIATDVMPHNPRLGLKAARHVALYTWLVRGMLRETRTAGGRGNNDDKNPENVADRDIIETMLSSPGSPEDAAYIMQQRKPPLGVLMRLRQIVAKLHHDDGASATTHENSSNDDNTKKSATSILGTAQTMGFDRELSGMNLCTLTVERIAASPIPPLYSAHTARLVMFNLFFLPLALRSVVGSPATIITTAAVGFAMLGLDEISFLLENPFRLMPLWYLSKASMLDVRDAIVCPLPKL